MKKMRDRIMLGLLVGFISDIPKTLSNEYFYRKGLEKRRFADIVAGIFLPKYRLVTKKATIFGIFGELVISSFMGIPLVYLLSYTGKDKSVIKGLVTGLFGFGFLRGLLANVGIGRNYPKDVVTNVMMSWSSSLWGVTAGLITPLLGDSALFKPNNIVLSNPTDVLISNNIRHKNPKHIPKSDLENTETLYSKTLE
ncbi:hypothetical protein LPY66_02370 [Dehalobacter sp. DCM]|uniref:hypothetical protein n=1 Tax=Dehalobacter sp. DCM TaxID=2907827 RepID=UPI003081A2D5|nr:hypothetical protein LPY66_02370 [Dehalobacter sp. DCM]